MNNALLLAMGLSSVLTMMWASRAAVRSAVEVGTRLRISPLALGFTLVAVGTDLPEMVNSIMASYMGHGDINVGDSVGSVLVQGSLVLGLLALVAPRPIPVQSKPMALLSGLTIALLILGMWLMADNRLGQLDAAILIVAWAVAMLVVWRAQVVEPEAPNESIERNGRALLLLVGLAVGALGIVAGASALLVYVVAQLAVAFSVPEYMASFFGAALGTSLPELVVNVTAMRRGYRDIALGGIMGACLADASLSLAVGPLLFPIDVSGDMAVRGSFVAVAAIALAGILLTVRRTHDRYSGAALLTLYLLSYFLLGGV